MKKRTLISVIIIFSLLIITTLIFFKINGTKIKADKVTKIVAFIPSTASIDITDKDKIQQIVSYINSRPRRPTIFIPKCGTILNMYIYYGEDKYDYYAFGNDYFEANKLILKSYPEIVDTLKALTEIR